MRKSNVFLLFVTVAVVLIALTVIDASSRRHGAEEALLQRGRLVAELDLTDLALFTEARYTRHPSQSDLHSAFQDHPMALEHFPTGSFLSPPQRLRP
jgi:hypothetical protein